MRLAIVNYAYSGAQADPETLLTSYRTLTGWAEALAKLGHTVSVVQRFRRDWQTDRNSVEYILCRDGDKGESRSRLWPARMHRVIAALAPDLVHVNGLDAPLQTWLLRRRLSQAAAMVVQDHGSGDPPRVGTTSSDRLAVEPRLVVRRTLMRAADAFFFTAIAQAREWQRTGLIGSNQLTFQVPEASTAMRPQETAAARRETGLQGEPAVLWVGRLNENKSPLTILAGFERSLASLPNAVLTMIYEAEDLLPRIQERLRSSEHLAGRVRLLGSIPHERMSSFYSAADVFVLGSRHEGSGYALIEACACGLPPVVTDIPTFRVITADGTVGALWPRDDAEAMANALVRVSQRDRSAQRRRVLDHFDRSLSWTAVSRLASSAYQDVMQRRAGR